MPWSVLQKTVAGEYATESQGTHSTVQADKLHAGPASPSHTNAFGKLHSVTSASGTHLLQVLLNLRLEHRICELFPRLANRNLHTWSLSNGRRVSEMQTLPLEPPRATCHMHDILSTREDAYWRHPPGLLLTELLSQQTHN